MSHNLHVWINYDHLDIIESIGKKDFLRNVKDRKYKQISIDLDRGVPSTSTKSIPNNQERKSVSFPHYTHHRHGLSSIDKHDPNEIHRLFSHAVKAQRHSDPYSIKWITEGPQRDLDSGLFKILPHLFIFFFLDLFLDKSYRTTNSIGTSVSPSQMLSLALSSSGTRMSISVFLICLLLSLR